MAKGRENWIYMLSEDGGISGRNSGDDEEEADVDTLATMDYRLNRFNLKTTGINCEAAEESGFKRDYLKNHKIAFSQIWPDPESLQFEHSNFCKVFSVKASVSLAKSSKTCSKFESVIDWGLFPSF